MKQLAIIDGEETLFLTTPSRPESRFTMIRIDANDGLFVLMPKDLLQVRDWINERARELQFQGYLADHLSD